MAETTEQIRQKLNFSTDKGTLQKPELDFQAEVIRLLQIISEK